ncbi:hypothetical protein OG792_31250 [Micromonospora sp. NBC_01699]|uniref:hypothetical protein n=1 Tax=Micromonospora sp. NBC_01699 TaxID=2975984 RepID=UPI002E28B918|nr:hypothetical protein [Micromonospora sp. NBC_01699]
MTVPAQRPRRWPNAPGNALRLFLVVILLVPVAVLFVQLQRSVDADQELVAREQHGIEYLRSLTDVTVALTEAQSAAVAGRPVLREALTTAVERTTAVDTRLGADLRTRERWAGVRAKIESLPDRGATSPDAVFGVYREAADLLLALWGKVRESSGLMRDPEADSYYLQDAVGEELPAAMIAAGRLADLAVIGATRKSTERLRTVAELTAARTSLLDPATDLIESLQAAVESTDSPNLGGNLLNQLDSYQRAIEALGASAALTDGTSEADLTQIAAARVTAHAAAEQLSSIILTELATLVDSRNDRLARSQQITYVAGALALLLMSGLAVAIVLSGRGRRPDPTAPGSADRPPAEPGGTEPGRWDALVDWPATGPAGTPGGQSTGRPVATAGAGSDGPGGWGRSDAAR